MTSQKEGKSSTIPGRPAGKGDLSHQTRGKKRKKRKGGKRGGHVYFLILQGEGGREGTLFLHAKRGQVMAVRNGRRKLIPKTTRRKKESFPRKRRGNDLKAAVMTLMRRRGGPRRKTRGKKRKKKNVPFSSLFYARTYGGKGTPRLRVPCPEKRKGKKKG